jgi:hypothetical protein
LGGVSNRTFVAGIGFNDYFISIPPFKWCLSSKTFILLFPLGTTSSLSKFSPRVSKGVCSSYKGPCPLNANFGFSRDHYYFACFSSFKFVLAMFRFFDGIIVRSKFGFFYKHVQVGIHPFNSPFS